MSVVRVSLRLSSKLFKNDVNFLHSNTSLKSNKIYVSEISKYVGTHKRNFSQMTRQNNDMTSVTQQMIRKLSTQQITKSLKLYSGVPINGDRDPQTLQLKHPVDRPIVLMLAWLNAKHQHLKKYVNLYVDKGYDVLTAEITPWQLLWPVTGSQLIAKDIINFLNNNTSYSPILIHGFSVGGYMFGECIVHILREPERYQAMLDRIIGQVWDSAADITEIPVGVPKALFPKNPSFQSALRKYMLYHLKAFHEPATQHYIRSSQMFHGNIVTAPALMFVSKTDPVGAVDSNMRVREDWESKGIHCEWKCWDRSPHVMHFLKHREEYLETLNNFLKSLEGKSMQAEQRIKAKL